MPAAGHSRLERLRAGGGPRTSYLSAASAAALRSVGCVAVGDVMGCATSQIQYAYVPTCRVAGNSGTKVRTGGSAPGGGTGYLGLVRRLYATALRRLHDEAVAMGADGVLGISLTSTERDQVTEVVARGTGVRVSGGQRSVRPFTTDLAGTDVTKLLLAGWVPVSLHVATQIGVRHLDLTSARLMRAAGSRWANAPLWAGSNVEVAGPSELVQSTKAATRSVLGELVATAGADGCLLGALDVSIREKECMSTTGGSGDLVALGVATGTSLARFSSPHEVAPSTLSIMPVGARPTRTTRTTRGARP